MYYDGLARKVRSVCAMRSAGSRVRERVEDHIAPVYLPLHEDMLNHGHTRYFLPGGRGSCKSSYVSLAVVDGIMRDPEANGIVFRRVAATLRDSVYAQCQWAIDELGVSDLWRGSLNPLQLIYRPTGQTISFKGMDDSAKLKSIRPPAHGRYAYVWLEELSEFTGPRQLRSILQSVVRGPGTFACFFSFNPPVSRNNWCNQYILQPDERAMTLHTTYHDVNPAWLGPEFVAEAEALKTINEVAYQNEYEGICTGSGGEVFPNIVEREITDEELHSLLSGGVYMGIDFGFSSDPTAIIRASYDSRKRTVYLLDEMVGHGWSNREIADRIKAKGYDLTPHQPDYFSPFGGGPVTSYQSVYCDSSEPKSVADLKTLGIRAFPCQKFPGSKQYGVRWLQHRQIVIDPRRTPVAHREFVSYEFATTRDGEFTTDLKDGNDHTIDSLRYGLDRLINDRRESA